MDSGRRNAFSDSYSHGDSNIYPECNSYSDSYGYIHANSYCYAWTYADSEDSATGKASPHTSAAPRASNQSMKSMAPLRGDFGMLATTSCHYSASS